MPCYDYRDSPSYIRENEIEPLEKELAKVEAILCGFFRVSIKLKYLDKILNGLNYKEMGLTKEEVFMWWLNHREKDNKKGK